MPGAPELFGMLQDADNRPLQSVSKLLRLGTRVAPELTGTCQLCFLQHRPEIPTLKSKRTKEPQLGERSPAPTSVLQ